MSARYFLAQDNDAHWYLVPAEKRGAWDAWLCIPSEDERAWDVPEWAKAIGGSPRSVTFTDPAHE